VKPSGPGAFSLPKLIRDAKIFTSVGIAHKRLLSSSEITGLKRSNKSGEKTEFVEVNNVLKCVMKEIPISARSEIHPPLGVCRREIELRQRRISVLVEESGIQIRCRKP